MFKEGGRRCIRNGTGNPPLCGPHHIVAADAARQAQPRVSTAFQQVSDLFDDFVAGRPLNRQSVGDVISQGLDELMKGWGMGGGYTPYSPPLVDESDIRDADPDHGGGYRRRRPPPRGWHTEEPQQDVDSAQLELDRAKARRVLGFGPRDEITRQTLKERFRALAMKHHPDRGGNVERMKEVSWANDVLEKAIP